MDNKLKVKNDTRQFVNQAWIRNGKGNNEVTGEALILACLLHTHGTSRSGKDFEYVQIIMDDANLDDKD